MTILYYLPNDIPMKTYQFPKPNPRNILVSANPRGMASCKGKAPQGGHDDIRKSQQIGWEELMDASKTRMSWGDFMGVMYHDVSFHVFHGIPFNLIPSFNHLYEIQSNTLG